MKKTTLTICFALCLFGLSLYQLNPAPTVQQRLVVESARRCIGDIYDSHEYAGGPPPLGRGACTDVVYYALLPFVDLQAEVNSDVAEHRNLYNITPNPDLDYRWCPTLIIWFERHWQPLPHQGVSLNTRNFRPGDVVFFDDGFGTPGHVGVISDRLSWDGHPLLIHNPGPICVEENALGSNRLVGHFRMPVEQK